MDDRSPSFHSHVPTCYTASTACHVLPGPTLLQPTSLINPKLPGLPHPTWQPCSRTMISPNMPCSFCPQFFHGGYFLTPQWPLLPLIAGQTLRSHSFSTHQPCQSCMCNFCYRSQNLAELQGYTCVFVCTSPWSRSRDSITTMFW